MVQEQETLLDRNQSPLHYGMAPLFLPDCISYTSMFFHSNFLNSTGGFRRKRVKHRIRLGPSWIVCLEVSRNPFDLPACGRVLGTLWKLTRGPQGRTGQSLSALPSVCPLAIPIFPYSTRFCFGLPPPSPGYIAISQAGETLSSFYGAVIKSANQVVSLFQYSKDMSTAFQPPELLVLRKPIFCCYSEKWVGWLFQIKVNLSLCS